MDCVLKETVRGQKRRKKVRGRKIQLEEGRSGKRLWMRRKGLQGGARGKRDGIHHSYVRSQTKLGYASEIQMGKNCMGTRVGKFRKKKNKNTSRGKQEGGGFLDRGSEGEDYVRGRDGKGKGWGIKVVYLRVYKRVF